MPRLNKAEDHLEYGGYQKFSLYKDKIVNKSELSKKLALSLPYLKKHSTDKTIIDIGCSNGGIGFNLYHNGYQNVTCVDQCKEILRLLEENNCYPWDIKLKEEILIKDGQVFNCNFGWCPTWNKDFAVNGKFETIPPSLLKRMKPQYQLITHVK